MVTKNPRAWVNLFGKPKEREESGRWGFSTMQESIKKTRQARLRAAVQRSQLPAGPPKIKEGLFKRVLKKLRLR